MKLSPHQGPLECGRDSAWRLHKGLCLLQQSEYGVLIDNNRSLGFSSGLHPPPRQPTPQHLHVVSPCGRDWRIEPRCSRMKELDQLLGHHQWRGPVEDRPC
jgi:hypothetical protein